MWVKSTTCRAGGQVGRRGCRQAPCATDVRLNPSAGEPRLCSSGRRPRPRGPPTHTVQGELPASEHFTDSCESHLKTPARQHPGQCSTKQSGAVAKLAPTIYHQNTLARGHGVRHALLLKSRGLSSLSPRWREPLSRGAAVAGRVCRSHGTQAGCSEQGVVRGSGAEFCRRPGGLDL